MGYWRTHYFKSERGFESDAQTEVFDLPSRGMLSNLCLEIRAQAGSENVARYVADILSKIEIIGNGSTVIKSYDGRQCQAIMAFDDLVMPPDKETSPSGTCWGYFDIRFGRFLSDEKYALNCGDWQSLELKLTYALTAGGVIDTTGFTAGSGYLTVWGLYAPVEAGFTPQGYIKSEEKKTYTTSAGGTEDLDLPKDYPYRRLLLFTETRTAYPNQAFRYTTINVNEGARKPLDRFEGDDFIHWQALLLKHGGFKHHKRYYIDNTIATNIAPPLWYIRGASVGPGLGIGFGFKWTTFDNNVVALGTEETTGDGWAHIDFWGLCPWGALVIDLERQSGLDGRPAMEAVWGCNETDDIDLEFEALTGSLAVSIVLEQYARR